MNALTNMLSVLLFCVLASTSHMVAAHVLKDTSAQVVLRDGQVEIKVLANTAHVFAAYRSEQAWLLGDIDELMPENLTASQQMNYVKNALQKHTRLVINQKIVPFEQVTLTTNSGAQPHDAEIIFQAKHTFADVKEVALTFPRTLGAVHASFVQPRYQLLGAGDTATVKFNP